MNIIEDKYCEVDLTDDINDSYDRLYDSDERYYAGFYIIWKNSVPIFANYFVFHENDANNKYKADKRIWENHIRDFAENPYSELNEAIDNMFDIDIEIINGILFEPKFTYEEIEREIQFQFWEFKRNYKLIEGKDTLFKKTKDAYNMRDMINVIDEIIEDMTESKHSFYR